MSQTQIDFEREKQMLLQFVMLSSVLCVGIGSYWFIILFGQVLNISIKVKCRKKLQVAFVI